VLEKWQELLVAIAAATVPVLIGAGLATILYRVL
jgi:hypothetical protein